jgi:hypothetical protein
MNDIEIAQKEICKEYGAKYVASEPFSKLGIALDTLGRKPLNALRHPPEGDTCGWYVWAGEELSDDPKFFKPLHVTHITEKCSEIVPYLGLGPGWRVLIAGDQIDVWYDEKLLNV